MAPDELHIRHIMLYEFRKRNNATQATKNINDIFENALDVRKTQRWFAKFRSGDLKNRGSLERRGSGSAPTSGSNEWQSHHFWIGLSPEMRNGFYVNVKRGKQWLSSGQTSVPTPKPGLHP